MGKVLWLASYPKSGNTWLRAFLANYLRPSTLPADINSLPHISLGDMRVTYYREVAGKPEGALEWPEINALRPKVHQYFAASGTGLVPVKTHTVLTAIDGVPTITPEVTFGAVYIVRNPFDVAVSFSYHYGLPIDHGVRAICFRGLEVVPREDTIKQVISDWSTHVRSWLGAPGLYRKVIRYEDMISSPTKAFSGVLEFLKMTVDRDRLRRAVRQSSFKVLAEQEKKSGFVERSKSAEKFFRRGEVGAWREEITDEQRDAIISQHRDVMIEMGYMTNEGMLRV